MSNLIQEFIDNIKKKHNLKIEKWEPNKEYYPEYMFLGGDRGILAYIYFVDDDSIPVDEAVKKVSRAESELDRPVFFIRNYQDLSKLYFETNEQIKNRLFEEKFESQYRADMGTVGDYDELVGILKSLKKNSVKFY